MADSKDFFPGIEDEPLFKDPLGIFDPILTGSGDPTDFQNLLYTKAQQEEDAAKGYFTNHLYTKEQQEEDAAKGHFTNLGAPSATKVGGPTFDINAAEQAQDIIGGASSEGEIGRMEKRVEERGEGVGAEGDLTLGERETPEDNNKGRILKALANFLTVFTAKDTGNALLSLMQLRAQQTEAEQKREHEVDLRNLDHVQAMEKKREADKAAHDYLVTNQDLYNRNQIQLAKSQSEYATIQNTIKEGWEEVKNKAQFDDDRNVDLFRANINGMMAELQHGLQMETGMQIAKERLQTNMANLAMSGAPPQVVNAYKNIATGQGSPEDIQHANQWKSIMDNMTSSQLRQQMETFFTSRYMDLAISRNSGEIGEKEYYYGVEGLKKSFSELGFGYPGKQLGASGDPNKLDKFQQENVAAGVRMLSEGRFENFSEFIDEIQRSPEMEWGSFPEYKKKQVIDTLHKMGEAFRQMSGQMAQDAMTGGQAQPQGPVYGAQGQGFGSGNQKF